MERPAALGIVYSRRRRTCPGCGSKVRWAWNVVVATTESGDEQRGWRCNTCRPGGDDASRADWPTDQAADAAKETPIMATATKTCPGVKDGTTVIVAPHDAPATEAVFGKNAARKDGLGRVCKVDWAKYTAVLKARAANGATPKAAKPAKEPKAPKAAKAPKVSPLRAEAEITDHALVATYEGQPNWSIETHGATRYAVPTTADTSGTDDGQEALSIVAKARDAQRKRNERAAKKEAVATA